MTQKTSREMQRAFLQFACEAAAALSTNAPSIAADISRAFAEAGELQTPRRTEEGAVFSHFPAADKSLTAAMRNCFCEARADSPPLFFVAARLSAFLQWRAAGGGKSPQAAVAELVGPDGWAESSRFRAGLFFQPARMFYAWHRHAAEELYLPLYGEAEWFAEGETPAVRPPLSHIVHRTMQAHALRTFDSPLFALWGWRGDIAMHTYELCPAPNTT